MTLVTPAGAQHVIVQACELRELRCGHGHAERRQSSLDRRGGRSASHPRTPAQRFLRNDVLSSISCCMPWSWLFRCDAWRLDRIVYGRQGNRADLGSLSLFAQLFFFHLLRCPRCPIPLVSSPAPDFPAKVQSPLGALNPRPPSNPYRWMPHSVLAVPAQRPARASSPGCTARVQGAQPMDRKPLSNSGWRGSRWRA